ncbi:hypothetical protein [Mesorhizobium sp. LSHC414A00]|uniref:hypothetical protein n=1 Tax=Mesorhizobium sp. LSHC414A00 TaxID=1287287 RepID=UPI0003CF2F0D|nr:hypothetical protein [Mesorhizobium sp. LSHC414A00]ESX78468.1 hypothetical protein X757_08830 [Mesorhizobium sp. LSHC414A00]
MSSVAQDQIDWLNDQIARAQIIIDGIGAGERWHRSHDGEPMRDVTDEVLRDYQDQVDRNMAVLDKWMAKTK